MAKKIKISNDNEDVNSLLKTAKTVTNALDGSNSTTKIQQINLLKSRVVVNIDGEGGASPKKPDPLKMDYGRLAVNYAKGYETLSTKNDADEIVEFKTIDYIKDLISNSISNIKGGETDSIKNSINDNIITSDLKLSNTVNNTLTTKTDGLYTTFTLRYGEDANGVKKPGQLILEAPNNVIQSVNLPLESFLVAGNYYEQYYSFNHILHKKVLVLIVRDEIGEEKEIIIPISDIVNIYTFNGDGRCIKVVTTPSAVGVNNYDVQVSLIRSPKSDNIFETTVDGAYVEDFRPYVDNAISGSSKEWKAYIDKQDIYYQLLAQQDATDKANKALVDAKAYSDYLDLFNMHLSGGTFSGEVKYANGSSNIFLNGSTNTYKFGSFCEFEEGSNLFLHEAFKINWDTYELGLPNIIKWDNMMPLSGGTFIGNVMFGPNTKLIFGHESQQIFNNNSSLTFDIGSLINHNNGSLDYYNSDSVLNHNNKSVENYGSGSTVNYLGESHSIHKINSSEVYETGSNIKYNIGANIKHNGSITDYSGVSVINVSGNTQQNYSENSQSNFNNQSKNIFNSGSEQLFNCGSKQTFLCNSEQTFKNLSKQIFENGTSSNFNDGSELIFGNGSKETHQNGSNSSYNNGSILDFNSGATTNHNGDTTNFDAKSIIEYKSGSTQNINSGSTENFNGGTQNFNDKSISNFNCGSEQNFNCDSEQNFTQDSTQNFSGKSEQHFNSGTTSNFNNGSELILGNGSKETHQNGSNSSYVSGSFINMDGGTQNFNCDSHLVFKCNAEQNFTENSSSNFNGNTEQNFNNGTNQNFNSGSTQEFFQGSEQIFHIGSKDTHESGSTSTYESGSTLEFKTGATTNHNGDTTNFNKDSVINYASGSTQNVQSGSSLNFDFGSNLEFTCLDGSKAQIDCATINHWESATDTDENNPNSLKAWVKEWVKDYVHGIIGDLVTDLTKEYMPITGGTFTGGVIFANQGIAGAIDGVTFENNVPLKIHSAHVDFFDGTTTFNYSNVARVKFDCPVEMLRNNTLKDATITNSLTTNLGSLTTFNGTTTFNNDTSHNRTITFPVKAGAYATNADIICRTGGPTQGITNIDCSGSINAADGGYQQPSDRTLKENFEDFDCTLEQIEQLSVIYYNYIGIEGKMIGVIAQEIKEICPLLVETKPNGLLAVDYSKLALIALKGVKLLTEKVKKQADDIQKIKEYLKID